MILYGLRERWRIKWPGVKSLVISMTGVRCGMQAIVRTRNGFWWRSSCRRLLRWAGCPAGELSSDIRNCTPSDTENCTPVVCSDAVSAYVTSRIPVLGVMPGGSGPWPSCASPPMSRAGTVLSGEYIPRGRTSCGVWLGRLGSVRWPGERYQTCRIRV